MSMHRLAGAVALALALTAGVAAEEIPTQSGPPQYGAFGLDLAGAFLQNNDRTYILISDQLAAVVSPAALGDDARYAAVRDFACSKLKPVS